METFISNSGKTLVVRIPQDRITTLFYSPFDLYFPLDSVTESLLSDLEVMEYDKNTSKKLKKLAEQHEIDFYQESDLHFLLYLKGSEKVRVSFPTDFRQRIYLTLLEREGGYPEIISVLPHLQGLLPNSQYFLVNDVEDFPEKEIQTEVREFQDLQKVSSQLDRIVVVVKTFPNEIFVFIPNLDQPLSLDPQMLIDYTQILELIGQPT